MMIRINNIFLILLSGIFLFSTYELLINNTIYPYAVLLFFSLISIGMYLSLRLLRKVNTKLHTILSVVALLNTSILFFDYLSPDLLKYSWNYSFAVAFLILFFAILYHLKSFAGKLAVITYWATIASGILIEIGLIAKVSGTAFHKGIFWMFLTSSLLILTTFALQIKKKH